MKITKTTEQRIAAGRTGLRSSAQVDHGEYQLDYGQIDAGTAIQIFDSYGEDCGYVTAATERGATRKALAHLRAL